MYRILLIEDEKVELDTLRNYVNWKGCGIDQVYTARGARSALECVNSVEPDIIISDIQMPGMSGIELARLIHEEGHECKIVFLTGYDRFEYAKEAISLHAEGFLLKPFQVEEVEEVVRNLVLKIDNERHEKRMNKMAVERIIDQACRGTLVDPEGAALMYFRQPASKIRFQLLGVKGLSEEERYQLQDLPEVSHTLWMDPFLMVIYPTNIAASNMPGRIQKLFPETGMQIVCCMGPVTLTSLYASVHRIFTCKEDLFYSEPSRVMMDTEHVSRAAYTNRVDGLSQKADLLEAMMSGDEQEAVRLCGFCIGQFGDMEQEACCQNTFSLFLYLHNAMEQKGDMDDQASLPNILHAESFAEMQQSLLTYVAQCCDFSRTIRDNRQSYYVKKFVSLHYMEPCTVEEMADEVHLSPNYLRKKFKEETGMTILEYLTEERMRKACELLRDPAYKVKDVAVAVGYENISYFTQLFAKKFGVTPNEYRKVHS